MLPAIAGVASAPAQPREAHRIVALSPRNSAKRRYPAHDRRLQRKSSFPCSSRTSRPGLRARRSSMLRPIRQLLCCCGPHGGLGRHLFRVFIPKELLQEPETHPGGLAKHFGQPQSHMSKPGKHLQAHRAGMTCTYPPLECAAAPPWQPDGQKAKA